jgi:serine/threonine protein kinase
MIKAGINHRDLKPANILINSNLEVKICDYGTSMVRGVTILNKYSKVTPRYYRSPELCLQIYDMNMDLVANDIWALGCVFAEILINL